MVVTLKRGLGASIGRSVQVEIMSQAPPHSHLPGNVLFWEWGPGRRSRPLGSSIIFLFAVEVSWATPSLDGGGWPWTFLTPAALEKTERRFRLSTNEAPPRRTNRPLMPNPYLVLTPVKLGQRHPS